MSTRAALVLVALCATVSPAAAQGPPLALPQPSPAATVTQQVGLTDITISYHRPAVNKREVWGKLVPYDQVWRAGANENTTIAFSTTLTSEARDARRSYGLHMIPTQKDWTIILSRESHAWGSFFYDQKDDAARFTVTPRPSDFVERLAYTFDEPSDTGVTATLHWEKMAIPVANSGRHAGRRRGQPAHTTQRAAGLLLAAECSSRELVRRPRRGARGSRDVGGARGEAERKLHDAAGAGAGRGEEGRRCHGSAVRDKAMTLATEADMNNYGYTAARLREDAGGRRHLPEERREVPGSRGTRTTVLERDWRRPGKKAEAITQYQKARSMVKDETNQKRIDGILKGLGAS